MGRPPKTTTLLSIDEVSSGFAGTRLAETPVLTVEQAAELAHVSVKTVYDWSHRGLLESCAVRQGKRLRIWRDKFVLWLFTRSN